MDIEHELTDHLNYLSKEIDRSSREYRLTIDTLYNLHKRLLQNSLKTFNSCVKVNCVNDKEFQQVWKYESVRLFLYNLGWRQERSLLVLRNLKNLQMALYVLQNFREPVNDLSGQSRKIKPPNNNVYKRPRRNKSAICVQVCHDQDDDDDDDDRNSQGFVSELEPELNDWRERKDRPCASRSAVTLHPIPGIANANRLKRPKPPPLIENTPLPFSNTQKNGYVADFSNKPNSLESARRYASKVISSRNLNPFVNAACIMQSCLATVAPLTGSNLTPPPKNALTHICDSAKKLINNVGRSAAKAVAGLGRLSAINISSGPDNSVNITSPKFFGAAAINIKSQSNQAVFNLISEHGPIATGISLTATPDSIIYSRSNTNIQDQSDTFISRATDGRCFTSQSFFKMLKGTYNLNYQCDQVRNDLENHLNYLKLEAVNQNVYMNTIKILYNIHKKILLNHFDETCSKIDGSNLEFLQIWPFQAVRLFLYNLGWRHQYESDKHTSYLFLKTRENLLTGVQVLHEMQFSNTLEMIKTFRNNEIKYLRQIDQMRKKAKGNVKLGYLYPPDKKWLNEISPTQVSKLIFQIINNHTLSPKEMETLAITWPIEEKEIVNNSNENTSDPPENKSDLKRERSKVLWKYFKRSPLNSKLSYVVQSVTSVTTAIGQHFVNIMKPNYACKMALTPNNFCSVDITTFALFGSSGVVSILRRSVV